jgi:hypothetical protein
MKKIREVFVNEFSESSLEVIKLYLFISFTYFNLQTTNFLIT